jgi:hypothetical protein
MPWKPVVDSEQKRSLAVALALEAGVLGKCRRHGCLFLGGEALEAALGLAERRFNQGALKGPFASREELAAEVSSAVAEQRRTDCPLCTKWMDE